MKTKSYRLCPGLAVLLFCSLVSQPASAALFWQNGVHTNDISVCFVGDSLARNTAFANLAMDYMREFEWYSGIRFTYIDGGVCPAATPYPGDPGRDYYAGTIRIILPGVTTVSPFGWVPGSGCPHDPNWENPDGSYNGGNDGWGSWANPPNDLEVRRSCIYNVKLGQDGDTNGTPWRNHTLHEIGHAIGLSHEHARVDVDPACTAPGYGGTASAGLMTPYDRNSVMHYQFLSCGIDGNYGHSGLSAWDRLAVHILYPEAAPVAELRGNLLLRLGDTLSLASAWQTRGALINNVAADFQWRINGVLVGTGPGLSIAMNTPGDHTLQYNYRDNLATVPPRQYAFFSLVRVLEPDAYERLMGAIANTATLLTSTGMEDPDGDGVLAWIDNCLGTFNPGQSDTDGDAIGNICDADIATPNDCLVNFLDLQAVKAAFFATPIQPNWNPDADLDDSGLINFADLQIVKSQFFGPPGPSAAGCN
ncbi:MAG: hypothetical protein KJO98_14545 [Rhodothermia bacterium]|nr:hypothetical protein [Rhodothermia bacterium]